MLSEAILNCKNYNDTEEMEMQLSIIAETKCPGFEYFLEIFVLQDFYDDLVRLEEFKSDTKKVEQIIHYAEFDA